MQALNIVVLVLLALLIAYLLRGYTPLF